MVTTHTELSAMAAEAIMGLSRKPSGYRTPAANGIPITLYINAQNRFSRIMRRVFLDSEIAVGIMATLPPANVSCAVSMAISEPPPRAIETLAFARASASLMPSPHMAT